MVSKLIIHAADIAASNEMDITARVRKARVRLFKEAKIKVIADAGDWVNLEKKHGAGRNKT